MLFISFSEPVFFSSVLSACCVYCDVISIYLQYFIKNSWADKIIHSILNDVYKIPNRIYFIQTLNCWCLNRIKQNNKGFCNILFLFFFFTLSLSLCCSSAHCWSSWGMWERVSNIMLPCGNSIKSINILMSSALFIASKIFDHVSIY